MAQVSYQQRRGELEVYFDRTAVKAWEAITSTAPVSRVRATVRAGRDAMRATLLSWLPNDLAGARLLDAGCGTGALAVEAAKRGAAVTAIDLSPNLVEIARERAEPVTGAGSLRFLAGDMLDPEMGAFDHVVAMDSLIHYPADEIVAALSKLAPRVRRSIVFTVAPRTPMLMMVWTAGKLFPRRDRAPAIEPVAEAELERLIAAAPALKGWRIARRQRINTSFYKSQALELIAPEVIGPGVRHS
jgi:magnesium-protoporphyrin O-methyltransferase